MNGIFERLLRATAFGAAYLPWLMLMGLGIFVFFAMPWSYGYPLPVILGAGSTMLALTYALASRLPSRAGLGLQHAKLWFWAWLGVGLALRLVYLYAVPPVQLSDSLAFSVLARNFVAGLGYRESFGPHELLAYRPPGYPFLLAGTMLLTGDKWWTPALINLLCYALSSLAIMDIAKRSVGDRAGLVAVAALAVWPSGVTMSGRALTEWPSLLLMLTTVWALLRGRSDARARWWLLAGLSTGLGALVRPQMLLIPVLMVGLALLEPGRWMAGCKFAAMAGLVTAACVAPWTVRNYMVLDAWVPISTNGGYNFYRANNGLASGGYEPYGEQSFNHLLPDEIAWNRVYMEAGKHWVAEHPARFARLAVRKLALLVGEDAEGAILSLKRVYQETGPLLSVAIALCSVWWLAIWVMMLIGLYRHRRTLVSSAGLVALMWLTLFLPLIHAVFESQPRYHMPMVGLLLLLAGLIAEPVQKAKATAGTTHRLKVCGDE